MQSQNYCLCSLPTWFTLHQHYSLCSLTLFPLLFRRRSHGQELLQLVTFSRSFSPCLKPLLKFLDPSWSTKCDLLPSLAAEVWVTANNILSSSWVLILLIVTTTKSILKLSKKKLQSRAVTFSPECVSRNKLGGHFFYPELLSGFLPQKDRSYQNSLNTNTNLLLI